MSRPRRGTWRPAALRYCRWLSSAALLFPAVAISVSCINRTHILYLLLLLAQWYRLQPNLPIQPHLPIQPDLPIPLNLSILQYSQTSTLCNTTSHQVITPPSIWKSQLFTEIIGDVLSNYVLHPLTHSVTESHYIYENILYYMEQFEPKVGLTTKGRSDNQR